MMLLLFISAIKITTNRFLHHLRPSQPIRLEELDHLSKSLPGGVMCKDDVACARNDVVLRRACRGIESRCHERGLVLGLRAVAAAEDEVLFAEHDVHGSFEVRRWGDDGAEGEEFAEGLGAFVRDLDGEDWGEVSREVEDGEMGAEALLFGSKFGKR